jgi:hypothetical protein
MPACKMVCGPEGRTWFRGEYLMWWLSGTHLPPLVTEDRTGATAGILGSPGTTVLFGDENVNAGMHSGLRFTLGHWLNCEQTCGLEANFFLLESQARPFEVGSDGTRSIGRPFFNVVTGTQDVQFVS